jgi:hydrogenase maturation protease
MTLASWLDPAVHPAAATLVIAVGNPARGDDALGPLLAERLAAHLAESRLAGVEVLTDFQLQVEHALDLVGRRRVIFVDASLAAPEPCALTPVAPAADATHTSHALSPAAVLDAYRRVVGGEAPEALVLAVRGYRFELGEALSGEARANLDAALERLVALLAGG